MSRDESARNGSGGSLCARPAITSATRRVSVSVLRPSASLIKIRGLCANDREDVPLVAVEFVYVFVLCFGYVDCIIAYDCIAVNFEDDEGDDVGAD